jgi:predicted translin family RNA/ssDNA-binding protein
LEKQQLISQEEAQKLISGGITLTEGDYILGIFDLIGELMRFAITTMATTGEIPRCNPEAGNTGETDILTDLRSIRVAFEALDTVENKALGGIARDMDKKMQVMKTCVEKVEQSVYGMIIRGRERPKGWIPDISGNMSGDSNVEAY